MRSLFTAVLLAIASGAFAADVTDPAKLFPSGTLAYIELGNPAATAEAVGKFAEGSVFAESLEFLQGRRDTLTANKATTGIAKSGQLSLLASPELLAEFKRFRGIGCGLTGFDAKTGRPQIAVAVLFGESHAAGLLARHFLASTTTLRRVGKIEGVAVYQYRGLNGTIPNAPMEDVTKPDELSPAAGTGEPTFLYAPGLFVLGTDVKAVGDAYRRFAGKETSASFATHKDFKLFEAVRNKAGLAFFGDLAGADKAIQAAKKANSQPIIDADAYSHLRFLMNLPNAGPLVGTWQVDSDVHMLSLRIHGDSPLAGLLSGSGALTTQSSSMPSFSLSLNEVSDKTKAVLNVLDAIAKARGEVGALPSERLGEAEAKEFAKLLRGLNSVNVNWPTKQAPPKGQPLLPLLELGFTTPEAATAMNAAVPKLVKWFAPLPMEPTPAVDKSQGNGAVSGLAFTVGERNVRFHYQLGGGGRLAFGLDPNAVAATPAVAVGKALPIAFGGAIPLGSINRILPEVPTVNQPAEVIEKRNPPLPKAPQMPKLGDALDKLPPITLEAVANGGELKISLKQAELKKPFAEFAKALLIWIESQGPVNNPGYGYPQYETIDRFDR